VKFIQIDDTKPTRVSLELTKDILQLGFRNTAAVDGYEEEAEGLFVYTIRSNEIHVTAISIELGVAPAVSAFAAGIERLGVEAITE
jgi:hypothetical protein